MQILHLQLKLIKNYAMIKLSNSIGGVFLWKNLLAKRSALEEQRKYIVEEDITIDMERAYIEAVKRETDISHKRLEK